MSNIYSRYKTMLEELSQLCDDYLEIANTIFDTDIDNNRAYNTAADNVMDKSFAKEVYVKFNVINEAMSEINGYCKEIINNELKSL